LRSLHAAPPSLCQRRRTYGGRPARPGGAHRHLPRLALTLTRRGNRPAGASRAAGRAHARMTKLAWARIQKFTPLPAEWIAGSRKARTIQLARAALTRRARPPAGAGLSLARGAAALADWLHVPPGATSSSCRIVAALAVASSCLLLLSDEPPVDVDRSARGRERQREREREGPLRLDARAWRLPRRRAPGREAPRCCDGMRYGRTPVLGRVTRDLRQICSVGKCMTACPIVVLPPWRAGLVWWVCRVRGEGRWWTDVRAGTSRPLGG
jgi:hypothetical protein